MLQVFDSWANELPPNVYAKFALPPCQFIAREVRQKLEDLGVEPVPMTLFAKGVNTSLQLIAETSGYDTLGLDWCIDPLDARKLVGPKVALQGNADPMLLYGGKDAIEAEVKLMSERFLQGGGGWIANLGHGVTPQVQVDDFKWFLECVHKYSKRDKSAGGEKGVEGSAMNEKS